MKRNEPSDSVPGHVRKIENQILGLVVLGPPEHLRPVLEIGPGLLGGAAAEGREAGQELKQDTAEGPEVDRVCVRFPA